MSNILGSKLKSLRGERQITQRQLASLLDIDTATYCKIEKGNRRVKREHIPILSDFLQIETKELLQLWSADKVYEIIADEDDATQILNIVAENVITYNRKSVKI
jgi:transcriptional regulator with XRE-family HTH domain